MTRDSLSGQGVIYRPYQKATEQHSPILIPLSEDSMTCVPSGSFSSRLTSEVTGMGAL